ARRDLLCVAREVQRPTLVALDAGAQSFPTVAVSVEVAMLERDTRAFLGLRDEPDLDLTRSSEIGLDLPVGTDVPREHDPLRRLVAEDTCPLAFASVDPAVVDPPAHARLEDRFGVLDAEHVVLTRLDLVELLRVQLERSIL